MMVAMKFTAPSREEVIRSTMPISHRVWPWVGMGMTAAMVGGLTMLAYWISTSKPGFDILALLIITPAWYLTVKLGVAGTASQRLAEERTGGTLELLLSTPLKPEEIARGQWLAIKRQFLWPAVATLVLIPVTAVAAAFFWTPMDTEERINWLATGAAMFFMLVADVAALGWTGMWYGISAKDAKQASGTTFAHIIALPNAMLCFWIVFVMLICWFFGWRLPEHYLFYLASWFVIGIVNDIAHFVICRRLFLSRLRLLAASRYLPPEDHSLWARAGRWLGLFVKSRR